MEKTLFKSIKKLEELKHNKVQKMTSAIVVNRKQKAVVFMFAFLPARYSNFFKNLNGDRVAVFILIAPLRPLFTLTLDWSEVKTNIKVFSFYDFEMF